MTATPRKQCLSSIENSQGITRCPDRRHPGAEYCATHLARAAEQFVTAIAEAKARHPSSAPSGSHPSAVPVSDLCRCGRPYDRRDCDT